MYNLIEPTGDVSLCFFPFSATHEAEGGGRQHTYPSLFDLMVRKASGDTSGLCFPFYGPKAHQEMTAAHFFTFDPCVPEQVHFDGHVMSNIEHTMDCILSLPSTLGEGFAPVDAIGQNPCTRKSTWLDLVACCIELSVPHCCAVSNSAGLTL